MIILYTQKQIISLENVITLEYESKIQLIKE